MADKTLIEWARHPVTGKGATWNPITGCTLESEGCRNCYAAKIAATRMKDHPSRQGLARLNAQGVAKFTGEVRFNEQWLDQPLRWKAARGIFVCAHSDLFAPGVPDEWIDRVFAVMALSPQHVFMVLTKRPARAREYLRDAETPERIFEHAVSPLAATPLPLPWPLPNVWLGTSVEDQATADERIPELIATPAALRFVSAEPLLGRVDINPWLFIVTHLDEAKLDAAERAGVVAAPLPFHDPAKTRPKDIAQPRLDWVIAGGESGHHARPMHPDWARSLRDQCAVAGVPFFFKQWGEYEPNPGDHPMDGRTRTGRAMNFVSARFGDGTLVNKVGKARAGRLLDGVTHDAMPGVRA